MACTLPLQGPKPLSYHSRLPVLGPGTARAAEQAPPPALASLRSPDCPSSHPSSPLVSVSVRVEGSLEGSIALSLLG